MQMTEVAETLDTSGLSCPLPILKTKKTMKAMNIGDILKVISTDLGSVQDIAAWVRMTG